ncbi:MAG: hypothetical protein H6735_25915 [Alphaproteobacteria bacterium]|nr:hypothetical protein [Alphaproteobacteria bacterium]
MIVGWLAIAAHADPPNRTVRLWMVGDRTGGYVERIAVSDDGEVVTGRTRADGKAFLFDPVGWGMHDFAGGACQAEGVAPISVSGADWTHEVWIACGNGTVIAYTWDGKTVSRMTDSEGNDLTVDVDTALDGIWWYDGLMYAANAPSGELGTLHALDVFASNGVQLDGAISGGSAYPSSIANAGFLEGAVVDGFLIISHGGQNMSRTQLGISGGSSVPNTFSTAFHCNDMAPSPVGGVYCVDNLGSIALYNPASNVLSPLPLGVIDEPRAVCANPDLSDGWLAVTGNQVKVWQMGTDGTIDAANGPYFESPPDADNPISDMATSDGYIWGGGIAGNLHIVTARPWAYPGQTNITPATGSTGTAFLVTSVFDQDVEVEVYLNSDRFGNGGYLLDTGTSIADEGSGSVLEVDGRYVEGDNQIYVIGTNAAGLTGHALATITVDNPPQPPELGAGAVTFDDGALILTFDGISDADLQGYEIWVATHPFSDADYPERGGPEFDGTTSLKTPIKLGASPSERITRRIAPLENDVTYYIGVRARDATGKEGPMSRVVQGTPRPVYTAAELAGDPGGTPCSTGPRGSMLGAAAVGLVALARRRRRTLAAVATTALFVGLGADANAADRKDDPWWRQDTTPAHADFEVRYGVINVGDQYIDTVYDRNAHNILMMEFGPQFFRYAELDFGFGFFQELSTAVATSGTGTQSSGKRTMLTWYPLALDASLRGHFVDEQPVVPVLRYGWDYVIWNEKADDGFGGKDTTAGGKFGTHYAIAANILLDLFQPGRASFLEAQTGINDSWLTLEWRRQHIDARNAPWSGEDLSNTMNFGGDSFSVGLKLDW